MKERAVTFGAHGHLVGVLDQDPRDVDGDVADADDQRGAHGGQVVCLGADVDLRLLARFIAVRARR